MRIIIVAPVLLASIPCVGDALRIDYLRTSQTLRAEPLYNISPLPLSLFLLMLTTKPLYVSDRTL